jgi:hypothetical protein
MQLVLMVNTNCSRDVLLAMSALALVSSGTRLGDWTANFAIIHRQHLVIAVNHTTLLPVIVPFARAKTLRAEPRATAAVRLWMGSNLFAAA